MSVLVVDKPRGPTSFGVVKEIQRGLARAWRQPLRSLKVGHGGTLDPMATGVLPVCVGEATKLAPFLLDADKTYEATLRLGVETDTLDAEGQVIAQHPVGPLTGSQIDAAMAAFRGEIEQVPPMFSALKRQGRPLYSYARAGEEVERTPRRVHIFDLELLSFSPPETVQLRVRCSKGTYVRTLAADLGAALGTGAHLTDLRRLASGPFRLDQALTLDEIRERLERGEGLPFVSLAESLAHLPSVQVSEPIGLALEQGKVVAWADLGSAPDSGLVRLLRPDGSLVAVALRAEAGDAQERVRTQRVFRREEAHGAVDPRRPGEVEPRVPGALSSPKESAQ